MHYKKEPCRNFQRGSCQYGERCKFLHVIQQPQKSSGFGFGMQTSSQQQQKPSPFGFGVHGTSQSKGAADYGSKQNQYKPFENKWIRSATPTNSAPSRKPDNQLVTTNHKCTDGESCKRQIADDFQNERPLWKLTCYGHNKYEPCDIVGDFSYEELRAVAYDEAKQGISLQSIVERERNLLNSKLAEFESLLHKPYVTPSNSNISIQSSFSGANPHSILPTTQNSSPPSLSSFSQLNASLNVGFGTRRSTAPNNAYGQPNQFPANSQQISSAFGTANTPSISAVAGAFGSQLPSRTFGNSAFSGFSNSGVKSAESNLPSSAVLTHTPSSTIDSSSAFFSSLNASVGEQMATNAQRVNESQHKNSPVDTIIWLKEKWVPGEIPEVAPPDAVIR